MRNNYRIFESFTKRFLMPVCKQWGTLLAVFPHLIAAKKKGRRALVGATAAEVCLPRHKYEIYYKPFVGYS